MFNQKHNIENMFVNLNSWISGSGPDGRITRKDIESFVPLKAAPVSQTLNVFLSFFITLF